jgi:hypothetical protein
MGYVPPPPPGVAVKEFYTTNRHYAYFPKKVSGKRIWFEYYYSVTWRRPLLPFTETKYMLEDEYLVFKLTNPV